MEATQEIVGPLRRFGLTDYAARAYVTLVQYGALTAAEISKFSRIPTSKIYSILAYLHARNWISVEKARPQRYHALSPKDAIASARLDIENSLKNLEENLVAQLQPMFEGRESRERPNIWIIRDMGSLALEVKEVIRRTRGELVLALPVSLRPLERLIAPAIGYLRTTGVRPKVLVTEAVEESTLRELLKGAELRKRDQMFGGGMVADSREALIVLSEEPGKGSFLAIKSDHVGLVKFAREYFEQLWQNAESL
jgi:sugar-specific transcriptional regulator TrmB